MVVFATREGLLGKLMASGIPCSLHLPSVALPDVKALYKFVEIANIKNGKKCIAIVLDVGPHHIHDDAYVFQGFRPQAELDKDSNKAGIDLSESVWAELGMLDNGNVDWKFLG